MLKYLHFFSFDKVQFEYSNFIFQFFKLKTAFQLL